MSTPDRNAERHAFVPIEWWPGAFALSAIVRRSRVKLSLLRQLTNLLGFTAYTWTLIPGVTKYKDWALCDPKLVREGCGDWTFGKAINLEWANETMEFVWNPAIPRPPGTADDAFVEMLIKEEETSEEYSWPPICSDLQIYLDRRAAAQSGLGIDLNGAVPRGPWTDGQRVGSIVITREYVSATKPPRRYTRTNEPMPTSVRGDYYGQPVNLPPCLHPYFELESVASEDAVIFDCSPFNADTRGSANKLVYPATNHQAWVKHIFYNKTVNKDGLYHRVEREVLPRRMNPTTYA